MLTSAASSNPPSGQLVGLLSDSSFTQLVNDALRNYQSTLALSRSPLASSSLVAPTLVKDAGSPTAEEQGHGLRLVLRWAVHQLAPAPVTYALGEYRPLDDPTWHDPRWWRYNILRHRYLEPLHPDDFVGGGRYTESLLALTGISSSDAFFDERNRAIREVAERLRQQFIDGRANGELQQMALREAMTPLEKEPDAATLLGIASIFDEIFPRSLLIEIATQEEIRQPMTVLEALIAQRFLLTGDEGASLWLSPTLRAYVYERQPSADRQRRHRWIAAKYERQTNFLIAARHWQRAEQDARAVRILLPVVDELVHELQGKELIDLLHCLEVKRLENGQWYAVQLLLSDLFQRSGQQEEALAACRQALKASAEASKQARVYRRMGKLYESRNQLHALRYYQQAVERFQPTDPELADLLKDRGWIYFYREEWEKAEKDLQQALHLAPGDAKVLRGDIYDLMANLYRKIGDHNRAIEYAERALTIREEVGDLLRIAKSQTNLGLLYRSMGEYHYAIAAYQEAITTYTKVGNQEMIAVALLNIGAAHFLNHNLGEALRVYRQSLEIAQTVGLPLIEIKAHYNLAEALAASHQHHEATRHWQTGYRLSQQHNFDDLEADFLQLQQEIQGSLNGAAHATASSHTLHTASEAVPPPLLDADDEFVLTLAQREQTITPKRLMQVTHISRATATRRLTRLVEKGWLTAHGQGRGAHYMLARREQPGAATPTHSSSTHGEVEQLQALLQQAQAKLAEQHAVDALELTPVDPTRYVRLVVHFTKLPDLEGYLCLKRELTNLLRREVDLVPEVAASLIVGKEKGQSGNQ